MFGLLDADGWAWAGIKAGVLAGRHHPDARLHPRPGLLPDGQPDRRPRRARLVADQLLPAGERDAALSGAGRGRRAVAAVAGRSWPCPRRGPTAASPRSGPSCCTSAARMARPPSRPCTSRRPSGRATSAAWAEGPALPEPASDASVVTVSGVIYVIGGRDAAGAPTTTVFQPRPRTPQTGDIGDVAAGRRRSPSTRPGPGPPAWSAPDGILLIGGEGPDGPVDTTLKSLLTTQGGLGAWAAGGAAWSRRRPMPTRPSVGDFVWLWGGHDANGPVAAVQRGSLGLEAAEGLPENPDEGKVIQWATERRVDLPAPARRRRGLVGQRRLCTSSVAPMRAARSADLYWAIPTSDGEIPEWKHLEQADLPVGLTRRRGDRDRSERGHRRRRDRGRASSPRASAPTPRRRARSSSSVSSARPSPASRSRARSASSSAT